DRVKCLHVLVGHSLAAGPGVNPLGDEAIAMLPEWWAKGPCVTPCVTPDEGDGRTVEQGDGGHFASRPLDVPAEGRGA
ncbi:DUF501 domain-containing protein, partial [Streptomyces sp. SID7499]|nr:DUF501 domain-containing protein [Streptomyces sp. SID7499]